MPWLAGNWVVVVVDVKCCSLVSDCLAGDDVDSGCKSDRWRSLANRLKAVSRRLSFQMIETVQYKLQQISSPARYQTKMASMRFGGLCSVLHTYVCCS